MVGNIALVGMVLLLMAQAGAPAVVLAAGQGVAPATAPEAVQAGAPAAVRVVPQLRYEPMGLMDPSGRFAVARGSYRIGGLCIVDVKRGQVAWNIASTAAAGITGFAFSSDGLLLALCSPQGGQFLDLSSGRTIAAPWMKGVVPRFSPDDKLLYVAADTKRSGRLGHVDVVQVYDLEGRQVRSYGLQINMVGRLSFSPDGKSLIVDGGNGVRLGHRAGGEFRAQQQVIDIESGESAKVESPVAADTYAAVSAASFDGLNFVALPEPRTDFAQQFTGVVWDASTASLAVVGRGQPEGGVIKLWNFKAAEFTATVGTSNNFTNLVSLRPGVFVGTAWHDSSKLPAEVAASIPAPDGPHGSGAQNLVTLIELPQAKVRPLAISARDWKDCLPSPDGRYVAGLMAGEALVNRLQVWDVDASAMIGEIERLGQAIRGFRWTTDGNLLVLLWDDGDRAFGWELFSAKGESLGAVRQTTGRNVGFSPSGMLLVEQTRVAGQGSSGDTYRLSIRKSLTGEELSTITGAIAGEEVLFLDEQRLLVADKLPGRPIRLLRASDQKLLWEATSADEVRSIVWQPGWSGVVIHYYGGADVLSVDDGRRLPAGAGDQAWQSPTLIHGGKLAVEPLVGSNVLELKETVDGRTVATLAAFADSQWIIFTSDGLWRGTPKGAEQVAFYRGTGPLTAEEIGALRQDEAVQGRLAGAVR